MSHVLEFPPVVVTRHPEDRLRFRLYGADIWAPESRLVAVQTRRETIFLIGCFHEVARGRQSLVERRIGPFESPEHAERAATALRAALGLELPRNPTQVTEAELRANPLAYDEAHIEVVGTWDWGFERSAFAGAWLNPPDETKWRREGGGELKVKARGFWRAKNRSYGHMGVSPAEFTSYALVETAPALQATPPWTQVKAAWLGDDKVTFEQDGEFDEWRLLVGGRPLPMLYNGTPRNWIPIGPCLRAPDPFMTMGKDPPRVYCVFSYGRGSIAGTAVYLMEGVSISLNADKSVILVEHVDVSDSSA